MRKERGFTLIELLIVVAIIGIIAAIAIPNLLNAIHRGRQKRTMADMRTVATAIGTYATQQAGLMGTPGDPEDERCLSLEGRAAVLAHDVDSFLRNMPKQDGWRTQMLSDTDPDGDHYTLQALAKDKANSGCGTSGNDETTLFDCDICHSDGVFIQWPEGIQRE